MYNNKSVHTQVASTEHSDFQQQREQGRTKKKRIIEKLVKHPEKSQIKRIEKPLFSLFLSFAFFFLH